MVQCAYCNYDNPVGEKRCIKCGLPIETETDRASDAEMNSNVTGRLDNIVEKTDFSKWRLSRLQTGKTIVLQVRGINQTITVPLTERAVMGRYDTVSGTAPEIDLTDYNARKQGVSRRHAAIIVEGDLLKLVDLESANSTYVNGQKLIANQSRILQDGDELRLGNLTLHIHFGD